MIFHKFLTVSQLLLTQSLVMATLYYPRYEMSRFCRNGMTDYIQLTGKDGGSAAFLKSSSQETLCQDLTDCSVLIASPLNHGIIIKPMKIEMTPSIGTLSIVQIDLSNKVQNLLYSWNSSFPDHLDPAHSDPMSNSNQTYIMVSFEAQTNQVTWKNLDFEILFTSFLHGSENSLDSCPELFYFDCGHGRCIRESLRCDWVMNCENGSDEHHCGIAGHEIFLYCLGGLLMVIMVVGLIWYSRRTEDDGGGNETGATNESARNKKEEEILTNQMTFAA